MAFDFLLDQTTNDLVLEDGELKFTTETPVELTQRLGIKLRTFQGEWFLDIDYGIPYLQQIISQARSKKDVDIIFLNAIRSEEDVNSVKNYNSTWDRYQRVYSFDADLSTSFGIIPVDILTKPANEWIYPDSGDDNSRVECEVTDIQYSANRLYKFINLDGLPNGTYSTWINQWTDPNSLAGGT